MVVGDGFRDFCRSAPPHFHFFGTFVRVSNLKFEKSYVYTVIFPLLRKIEKSYVYTVILETLTKVPKK